MKANLFKKGRKFRITRYYLWKYFKTWKNPNRNMFWYSVKSELQALKIVIKGIKTGHINWHWLDTTQQQFIKDIYSPHTKRIKYGSFEYNFTKKEQ